MGNNKEINEIIIERDSSVWGHKVRSNSEVLYLMFSKYTEEPVYEDVVTTDEEGNEATTKVKVFDCKGCIEDMVANGWILIDKRNEPDPEPEPDIEHEPKEEEVTEV